MTKMFSMIVFFSVIVFPFLSKLDAQSTDRAKDEQAIRAAATAYQNAFNQGDAKTIGSMTGSSLIKQDF